MRSDPNRTDIHGFYRLDGEPVVVRPGRGPETPDGRWVDWTEWAHRAVRISRVEYQLLVRSALTGDRRGRRQGVDLPTIPPTGPRNVRRAR